MAILIFYIQTMYLGHRNLDYLMHDVICKYWPWANHARHSDSSGGNEITPCLPVMHAKAHTWHCQASCYAVYRTRIYICILKVLWGARWQDGAGTGSREDMELFFSYISRWSPSTKYMLAYRKYIENDNSLSTI